MFASAALSSPSFEFIDADVPFLEESTRSIGKNKVGHKKPSEKRRRRTGSNAAMVGSTGVDGEARNLVELDAVNAKHPGGYSSTTTTPNQSNFNIITINVSGLRFQTTVETLERYSDTLLGNPLRRQFYYNPAIGEYFFDRHRASFEAILYFYQAGRIKRPEYVPIDIFLRELKFFEMTGEIKDKFWTSEGYIKPMEQPLPKNKLQRQIWQLMEHPDSSKLARCLAFVSVFVIVVSIVTFCLETIPSLKTQFSKNKNESVHGEKKEEDGLPGEEKEAESRVDWGNPFFCVELACIVWFTVEFLLRFISSPSKIVFAKSFLNIIDFVAIMPFYINLLLADGSGQSGGTMSFAVLRVLRLVRVFRIFKLSRHSVGLQILGKTFAASTQELFLVVFFVLIAVILFSSAVYFVEMNHPETHFDSIPSAFWYAIVTMTTVGYGDMVPKSPWGKLVGGFCAIIGVMVLALPVPVIVANFKHFYRQETRLAQMRQLEEKDEDIPDDASLSS